MNEVELIGRLILEGLVVKDGEKYVFTNTYKRLKAGTQVPIEQKKPEAKKITELLSPKELLKKFVKDSEVPFRVPFAGDSRKTYTVAALTDKAIREFYLIMMNESMKYESMVAATKAYYQSSSARKTITNYICEGILEIWVETYEESLKNNTVLGGKRVNSNRVSL